MPVSVKPHLMFEGVAGEAMAFYVSLFADAQILEVEEYGNDEAGRPGSIKRARFELAGQEFICSDSPIAHDFTFTPSMSIFVDCESEEEVRRTFDQLAAGGETLMPMGEYGFSALFGWVNDRYGVSWQLNLA